MSFQIFLSHSNGDKKKIEIKNQVKTNFKIRDEEANIKLGVEMLENNGKRIVKSNNSKVKQKEGCMMI
jgi:uncharacterized membrane protein